MRKPRKEAVYYPDDDARKEAEKALDMSGKLMKQPVFTPATMQSGWSCESNKPLKYASLAQYSLRFAGTGVPGTRTKGTRLFRLDDGFRPASEKYLGVDVKGLPKGGLKASILGLIGLSLNISEGLTTGRIQLIVSTDGWVTLNDELSPSCILVFDGSTIDLT